MDSSVKEFFKKSGSYLLFQLFGLVISLSGLYLIAKYANWQVAIGVFFCWWGSNIHTDLRRRARESRDSKEREMINILEKPKGL